MCNKLSNDKMFSSLGSIFIIFLSEASTPNDCAGGPSIIIFIHNNCTGLNGKGNTIIEEANMVNIAAILVDNWNFMKRLILEYMVLPSLIA